MADRTNGNDDAERAGNDRGGSMAVDLQLQHEVVAVQVDTELHLLVELTMPPAPVDANRQPLRLALVVDRSGSMSGPKLAAVAPQPAGGAEATILAAGKATEQARDLAVRGEHDQARRLVARARESLADLPDDHVDLPVVAESLDRMGTSARPRWPTGSSRRRTPSACTTSRAACAAAGAAPIPTAAAPTERLVLVSSG